MKKKKRFLLVISIILLICSGCGATKSTNKMEPDMTAASEDAVESPSANTEEGAITGTNTLGIQNTIKKQQKLIKNVSLSVETKTFDSLLEDLNKKIIEMGGYIESSEINGNSYQYETNRWANLVIRIPCHSLETFITVVDKASNITNKSESTEDVTLQYVDMSSHITALRTEQESLMKILKAAVKLEDIIKIQSQLTQVRYEIESYESQLRTYDNLVDYSTVTVTVNEVMRETTAKPGTFLEKISEKFSDNLYDIGQGLQDFTIWFLSSIPYFLLWAILATFLIFIYVKIFKKRIYYKGRKRKEKEESETKKGE
ncbi:MAG: DUF4349 domain-containing protein [Acetivibrio sp.]